MKSAIKTVLLKDIKRNEALAKRIKNSLIKITPRLEYRTRPYNQIHDAIDKCEELINEIEMVLNILEASS